MKPAFARLHVLLAQESRIGLVIRHGTAKSVCTLLWDRATDRFTLGQWMRGRIDIETCDLSPDGRYFLYSASKIAAPNFELRDWTVVSRDPYLKALAYYSWKSGGGWFLNDRDYSLRGLGNTPQDRESPEVRRVIGADPPKPSLYAARMVRAGWTVDEESSWLPRWLQFFRSTGAGWELRHSLEGGYRLTRGELSADTAGWDWADIDAKRLVWTSKGCLWSGAMSTAGIEQIQMLHDFNGMKFEAIEAPYEGGRAQAAPPKKARPLRRARR